MVNYSVNMSWYRIYTWLVVLGILYSGVTAGSSHRSDYLMRLKCRAKCDDAKSDICDFDACLQAMRSERKLGSCPKRSLVARSTHSNGTTTNHLWSSSNCIDTCEDWDYNCPEAEKCCPSSCGTSCHRPVDLERIKQLPPIPSKLSVIESRRKIEICWGIYSEILNKSVYFVIEGRYHLGYVFSSHKLSDWTIFHGHLRYDHVFRESSREIARRWCFILKIKPGRWYQFRVASVNENGTKGFSKHSTEFHFKDPRNGNKLPKPPRNVTIGPVQSDRQNASLLSATLSWSLQRTQNIPIDKYKIFWSREELPGSAMQTATVPEPQRYFELRQLLPYTTYYIQVQAISIVSQKRLRSKKISITLNTTGVEDVSRTSHLHVRHLSGRNGNHPLVRLRFTLSKAHELLVKVHWPNHQGVYSHFQLDLCQGPLHCLQKSGLEQHRSVNLTRASYEFSNLDYNSVYSIRLKSYRPNAASDPKVAHRTFVTPECSTFKRKYNLKELTCRKTEK